MCIRDRYFDALENNNQATEDKWVIKEFLEQRLKQFKQECKKEIWKELILILVGSRMLGQPFMMLSHTDKPGTEEVIEDGKQI